MIKDISNIRRLPRLGCIRLGIKQKTKSGKEYPKEVDYFILDPETPSQAENQKLIQEFHGLYGDRPKAIKIMFPLADPEKYFPQNYKRYGSTSSLKCIGDGESAICTKSEFSKGLKVLGKTETGLTKVECHGKACIYAKKECSAVGVLRVLLPELQGAGVWQITTGSFHSIVNLNSCIDYIAAVCGRAHMIPLMLERRPQETTYEGKKATHYILHVNMDFKLAEIQKIAQTPASQILLDLPSIDTVEEVGTVVDIDPVELAPEQPIEESANEAESVATHDELMALSEGEDLSLPIEQEAQTATEAKIDFFTFMNGAKKEIIELTGDSGLYNSELETFSVRFLSELKGNTKKQADIKKHFKSLLIDTRELNKAS